MCYLPFVPCHSARTRKPSKLCTHSVRFVILRASLLLADEESIIHITLYQNIYDWNICNYLQERQGCFHKLLEGELLPTLLEAGVLFLLRWALDDSVESVVSVALQAFAAVLTAPRDEVGQES